MNGFTGEAGGLEDALESAGQATDAALADLLPDGTGPESEVFRAMRYSALSGGKRIRPFLVLAGAALFNVSRRSAERTAAATEMVHCYSLIHDDLPAMDDDDLRRGQPSCHVKFGEATAILAGDGLLTLAFEVLAGESTHSQPEVRAELVVALARAAGAEGMVGGQMIDVGSQHAVLDMPQITRLQRLKTGALIGFACAAGAILGKAPPPLRQSLAAYAHDLGLAFQISDDLLDVEGSAAETGKATGKDAAAGKATFVSLLGAGRAREQAEFLAEQAVKHLEIFEEKGDRLCALARFVVNRRH